MEKFEKQKNELNLEKEQYEKKLKEKYEQELESKTNQLQQSIHLTLENYKKEIEQRYEQIYKNKELEMKKKYDDMSTLMIKKFDKQNNNNINISNCRTVHNGIKCEKCFKEPIVGYRYKCSICNNYNLCQDCEEKNAQTGEHEHDFIKIRKVENLNRNTIINNQNNFNAHNLNINNDNNGFRLLNNEYSYECLKNNLVKASKRWN